MSKYNTKTLPNKLDCERGLIAAWTENKYDSGWEITPEFFTEAHRPIVEKIQQLHKEGKEYHFGAIFTSMDEEGKNVLSPLRDVPPDFGDFYAEQLILHRRREKLINNEDTKYEEELLERYQNKEPLLEVWKPSKFRDYEIPEDYLLVGNSHLTRGNISVVGGYPGVGKSRAVTGLAVAGAIGEDWMGLEVNCKFKTLVLQVENGDARLKDEFTEIGNPGGVNLDDWLRVSRIPVQGLDFNSEQFRKEVKALIKAFEPGVIAIDAWNRVVADDKAKDYKLALDAIFSCLPAEQSVRPAVVIVHHMRKKSNNHSKRMGKDLLHELSGSYCLGSAARSVFVLESASTETTDDRLVFTCCKNNDGEEGQRTAWYRRNGLFAPCSDFDWEEFDKAEQPAGQITSEQVREAVGVGGVSRSDAAKELEENTGKSRATCFKALQTHMDYMEEDTQKKIYWKGELSHAVSQDSLTETI